MKVQSQPYVVEKVLKVRTNNKGNNLYLIKWKGWSVSDSTWQPEQHLDMSTMKNYLVKFYERKLRERQLNRQNNSMQRMRERSRNRHSVDPQKQLKKLGANGKSKFINKKRTFRRKPVELVEGKKVAQKVKRYNNQVEKRTEKGEIQIDKQNKKKQRRSDDNREDKKIISTDKHEEIVQGPKKRGRKPLPPEQKQRRLKITQQLSILKKRLERCLQTKFLNHDKIQELRQQILKLKKGSIINLETKRVIAIKPQVQLQPGLELESKAESKLVSSKKIINKRQRRQSPSQRWKPIRSKKSKFALTRNLKPTIKRQPNHHLQKALDSQQDEVNGLQHQLLTCENIAKAVPIFLNDETHFQIQYEEDEQSRMVVLSTSQIVKVNPRWVIDFYKGFLM